MDEAQHAAQQGDHLLCELKKLRADRVKEVRGRGLMIAVEFYPEPGGARSLAEALKSAGILCKDTHEHTLRFAPPLVIKRDQVDWMLGVIDNVLHRA